MLSWHCFTVFLTKKGISVMRGSYFPLLLFYYNNNEPGTPPEEYIFIVKRARNTWIYFSTTAVAPIRNHQLHFSAKQFNLIILHKKRFSIPGNVS